MLACSTMPSLMSHCAPGARTISMCGPLITTTLPLSNVAVVKLCSRNAPAWMMRVRL